MGSKYIFTGYASVFGIADQGCDVVMPGAFRNSLRQRGARGVKMLYQHNPSHILGVWQMIKEDGKGLYVEGILLPDIMLAHET